MPFDVVPNLADTHAKLFDAVPNLADTDAEQFDAVPPENRGRTQ